MNILNELYTIISTYAKSDKKQLSKARVMEYLLGNEMEDSLDEPSLYKIYHGYIPKYNILNKIASFKDRSLQRLAQCISSEIAEINITGLLSAAGSLLDTKLIYPASNCVPSSKADSDNDPLSPIINSLVFLHFFNTPNPDILFLPNGKSSCRKYVKWPQMEKRILSMLKNDNIIFLTGNPGSGKKELLINCLPKYCSDFYLNIHWLNAPVSTSMPLEKQLLGIQFREKNIKNPSLTEIHQLLSKNNASSILVINRPAITQEDLDFCKTLSKIGLKIIITTLRKSFPDDCVVLNIDNRPNENLKDIFSMYYPDSDFTDEEFQTLFKITDNNVYVLTLIANALSRKKNTFTKDMVLNDSEWIWYRKNTPKLHSSYHDSGTKSGQLVLNLVGRILSNYSFTLLNDHASELSIWAKTPISKKILITKWDKTIINDCVLCGILQYYDNAKEKLFMPSLIADAIWNQYPIDYKEYKEKIFMFLTNIEYGKPLSVSYSELYQIIFNMILRFHFQVTALPSRPDKESKELFKDWNLFLTAIIEKYMKLGNYHFAQNVLPYLYAARSKKTDNNVLSELQTSIRELLYRQSNYMQSDNIAEALDELIPLIINFCTNPDSSDSDMETFLYLCHLICKDMAEHAINTTLNLLSKAYMTENWLNALGKLSELLATQDDYYALLLKLTYHYTSLIVKPDCPPFHFNEICNLKKLLLSTVVPSDEYFREITFHFKGLCIYFNAILYLQCKSPITIESFEALESEYNDLCFEFKKALWPYHASYTFYTCTFLFVSLLLPHCHQDSTFQNLEDSMKRCKSFNHKQLSLSVNKIAEYDFLIDTKIKELHEYVSHKNKSF